MIRAKSVPLPLARALVVALTAAAALSIGACGSDDSEADGLTAYFKAISGTADVAKSFRQLDEELSLAKENAPVEATIVAYAEYFDASAPLLHQTALDLEGVQPPAGLEDEHQRLVAVAHEMEPALRATGRRLRSATTLPEVREIVASELLPVVAQFQRVCGDLVSIALSRGVEIGSDCPGLPVGPPALSKMGAQLCSGRNQAPAPHCPRIVRAV